MSREALGWPRVAPAGPVARVRRGDPGRRARTPARSGLHLPAGMSARGERARLRSVDTLLDWAGGAADDNTILMGDLNSVARGDVPSVRQMPLWLRLLLRFDGGIRTDVQDRLAAAGWIDAFRHLHPGEPGFTLPAVAPQVRLDYMLVPAGLLPRVTGVRPGARRAARRRGLGPPAARRGDRGSRPRYTRPRLTCSGIGHRAER